MLRIDDERGRLLDGAETAPSANSTFFDTKSQDDDNNVLDNHLHDFIEDQRLQGLKLSKWRALPGIVFLTLLCASFLIVDFLLTYRRGYFIFDMISAKISIESGDGFDAQALLSFSAESKSIFHSVTVHNRSTCEVFYDGQGMSTLTFDTIESSPYVLFGSQLHESPKTQQDVYVRLRETNFELARSYYRGDKRNEEFAVICSFQGTINLFDSVPVESSVKWTARAREGKLQAIACDLTVLDGIGPWRVYDEDSSSPSSGLNGGEKKDLGALPSLIAGITGPGISGERQSRSARPSLFKMPSVTIDDLNMNSGSFRIQVERNPDVLALTFPVQVDIPSFSLVVAQTGRVDRRRSNSWQEAFLENKVVDYSFEEVEETLSGTTPEGAKLYPAFVTHSSPSTLTLDNSHAPVISRGRTRCLMLSLAQLSDDIFLESIRNADIGAEIGFAPSCSLAYPFFMGLENVIRFGRSDTSVVLGGKANLLTSFIGRDHTLVNAVDSKVAQAAHRRFGIDVATEPKRRLDEEKGGESGKPFTFSSIRAFAEFVPFLRESGILGPLSAASDIPWKDYIFSCHTVIFDDDVVMKECVHLSESDLDLELTVQLPPFMSTSNFLRYHIEERSLSMAVGVSDVLQADVSCMVDPDTDTLRFHSAIDYEESLHFALGFNGTLLLRGDSKVIEGGLLVDYKSESTAYYQSFRGKGMTAYDAIEESRDFSLLIEEAPTASGPFNYVSASGNVGLLDNDKWSRAPTARFKFAYDIAGQGSFSLEAGAAMSSTNFAGEDVIVEAQMVASSPHSSLSLKVQSDVDVSMKMINIQDISYAFDDTLSGNISATMAIIDYNDVSEDEWKRGAKVSVSQIETHRELVPTSRDYRALFVFMLEATEDVIFSVESDVHVAKNGESTFDNEALAFCMLEGANAGSSTGQLRLGIEDLPNLSISPKFIYAIGLKWQVPSAEYPLVSIQSGVEYKDGVDDVVHLRDFACSASLPGNLYHELSGAYMVKLQDGSRKEIMTSSFQLDWAISNMHTKNSNNRIRLIVTTDNDHRDRHAVIRAEAIWKGGVCQSQCEIHCSSSYVVTKFGNSHLGFEVSLEMPSVIESTYTVFVSLQSAGTLGSFANDVSLVWAPSSIHRENQGGLALLLTDKCTVNGSVKWEGHLAANSSWTAQWDNAFQPEITFNSLSSYHSTSFGDNQIRIVADVSVPDLLKNTTEIILDVSSAGSLINLQESSEIGFSSTFVETSGSLCLYVDVESHNGRFDVMTNWAKPGRYSSLWLYRLSSGYGMDSFGFNEVDMEVNMVSVPDLLDAYYEIDLSLQSIGGLYHSNVNSTATVVLIPQFNLTDEGSLTLSVIDSIAVNQAPAYFSEFSAQSVWTQQLSAPEIDFSSSSRYSVPSFGNNDMIEVATYRGLSLIEAEKTVEVTMTSVGSLGNAAKVASLILTPNPSLDARHGNMSLELSFGDIGFEKSRAISHTSWYGHADEGGRFEGYSAFIAKDFGNNCIKTDVELWYPSLISDHFMASATAESSGTVMTKNGDIGATLSVGHGAGELDLTLYSTNAGASASAKTSWVKDKVFGEEPRWTFTTSSNYSVQTFGTNHLEIDAVVASDNFLPGYYKETGSIGFNMKSFVQSYGSLLPVTHFTDRTQLSMHLQGMSDFSNSDIQELAFALIEENSVSNPTHVYVTCDIMHFELERDMFLDLKVDYNFADFVKGSLSEKMRGGLPVTSNPRLLPAYYLTSETAGSGPLTGHFFNSFGFRAGARVDMDEGSGDLVFVLTDSLVGAEISEDWSALINSELRWVMTGEGQRQIYGKMVYEPPSSFLASGSPSSFLCDITISPPSLISAAAEVDATVHLEGLLGLDTIYESAKIALGQKFKTDSGEIIFKVMNSYRPAARASVCSLQSSVSWERSNDAAKATSMRASAAYNIDDYGVERLAHLIVSVPNQRGGVGGTVDVKSYASGSVLEANNSLVSMMTTDKSSSASRETSLRVYDTLIGPAGTKHVMIEADDSMEVYSDLFRNALRVHASAPPPLLSGPISLDFNNEVASPHLLSDSWSATSLVKCTSRDGDGNLTSAFNHTLSASFFPVLDQGDHGSLGISIYTLLSQMEQEDLSKHIEVGVDWKKRNGAPQHGFKGNASYFISNFGDNVAKTALILGNPDMLNSDYTLNHSLSSRGDLVDFDNDLAIEFSLSREKDDNFEVHVDGENLLVFNQSAVSHNMVINLMTKGSQDHNYAVVNTASMMDYGLSSFGRQRVREEISLTVPDLLSDDYVLTAQIQTGGTLADFTNDVNLTLSPSGMSSESQGGIDMVLIDKHTDGEGSKEGHFLANSTWTGQWTNVLEPEVTLNSLSSYKYPSYGESDMNSTVAIIVPSLINSDLTFSADIAMAGSLLTLDDNVESTLAIDLDHDGGGNMTMRLSGMHRPSGKQSGMHIDTSWSGFDGEQGAKEYLVASTGAYIVPGFGESSLGFHTETAPVAGNGQLTSSAFSMRVMSGAVGSVANFNNDMNMTYDAIWADDGRLALFTSDSHWAGTQDVPANRNTDPRVNKMDMDTRWHAFESASMYVMEAEIEGLHMTLDLPVKRGEIDVDVGVRNYSVAVAKDYTVLEIVDRNKHRHWPTPRHPTSHPTSQPAVQPAVQPSYMPTSMPTTLSYLDMIALEAFCEGVSCSTNPLFTSWNFTRDDSGHYIHDVCDGGWYGASCESSRRSTAPASLKVLNLSHSGLSGTLSPDLGSLVSVEVVDLSHNSISGGIPSRLGDLQSLSLLRLDDNLLSGHIDMCGLLHTDAAEVHVFVQHNAFNCFLSCWLPYLNSLTMDPGLGECDWPSGQPTTTPTFAPTRVNEKHTHIPSAMPTSTPTVDIFSAHINVGSRVVLEGPSMASWNNHTEMIDLAFKRAMARSARSPFYYGNFRNIQVKVATSGDLKEGGSRRLSNAHTSTLSREPHGLVVLCELSATNVHGATPSMVVSRLVNSGPQGSDILQTFLREEVASLGLEEWDRVDVRDVTAWIISPRDASSSEDKLTAGGILGITLSVIFVALLFSGGYYYYYRRQKQRKDLLELFEKRRSLQESIYGVGSSKYSMYELDNHLDLENNADAADGIVRLRDVYADSRIRGHSLTRNPMLSVDGEMYSQQDKDQGSENNDQGSLDIEMTTNPLKRRLSGNVAEEGLSLAMQGTLNPLFAAVDLNADLMFDNRSDSFVGEENPLKKLERHQMKGTEEGRSTSFLPNSSPRLEGVQSVRSHEAPLKSSQRDVIPRRSLEALSKRVPPGPPSTLGAPTRAKADGTPGVAHRPSATTHPYRFGGGIQSKKRDVHSQVMTDIEEEV